MAYNQHNVNSDGAMDDDEDWLDDTPHDQGAKTDPLVNQEWTRISSKYSDAGYREGITDGKLSTLQKGFDEGYALSSGYAFKIGSLRGRSTALLQYLTTSTASNTSTPSTDGNISPDALELVDEVRTLIKDLGMVRRDEILPRDLEREEHEKEHEEAEQNTSTDTSTGMKGENVNGMNGGNITNKHRVDDGFELDQTAERDMEGLEMALEGMGGVGGVSGDGVKGEKKGDERWGGKKGQDLVGWFETRVRALEERAYRI